VPCLFRSKQAHSCLKQVLSCLVSQSIHSSLFLLPRSLESIPPASSCTMSQSIHCTTVFTALRPSLFHIFNSRPVGCLANGSHRLVMSCGRHDANTWRCRNHLVTTPALPTHTASCSVLQSGAECCSTNTITQHYHVCDKHTHRNALSHTHRKPLPIALPCHSIATTRKQERCLVSLIFQRVAQRCSVLQCVAGCCSVRKSPDWQRHQNGWQPRQRWPVPSRFRAQMMARCSVCVCVEG